MKTLNPHTYIKITFVRTIFLSSSTMPTLLLFPDFSVFANPRRQSVAVLAAVAAVRNRYIIFHRTRNFHARSSIFSVGLYSFRTHNISSSHENGTGGWKYGTAYIRIYIRSLRFVFYLFVLCRKKK